MEGFLLCYLGYIDFGVHVSTEIRLKLPFKSRQVFVISEILRK